ncbi:BIG2 domain-containing protein [Pseudomonas serboccidentalis]
MSAGLQGWNNAYRSSRKAFDLLVLTVASIGFLPLNRLARAAPRRIARISWSEIAMTALYLYTPEQLAALQAESPQQWKDPFAEIKSAGLFAEDGSIKLFPILIPGWHPVDYPQALYGVGADETAGTGQGWYVLIGSYLQMAPTDTIRVFRGKPLEPGEAPDPGEPGTLIKTLVVPVDHNNQNIVGILPRTVIDRSTIYSLWYSIERASGSTPELSERIIVWFKPTFPDSLDPTGDKPERLPLEAPRFPPLIDKDMSETGVDFIIARWPVMTPGDTVKLTIANQVIYYVTKPEEIGQDIVVTVSSAILKLIGPADPLLVSYQIIDQVQNASLTSKVGVGILDPDTTYLEAPSVPLTLDDVLAIDDLGGAEMEVDVPVRRADAIAGDKVDLTLLDTASGYRDVFGPLDYKAGVVTFKVPFALVRKLAPTILTLSYQRIRIVSGSEVRTPSYPYSPRLIGEQYRAPAPTAPDARGAVFAPELESTVVYAGPGINGISVGDTVTLTCLSTSAGGTTRLQTYERIVTRSMDIPGVGIVVPFDIETRHFGTYRNGSIACDYQVTGGDHDQPLLSFTSHFRIGHTLDMLAVVEVGRNSMGVLDPKDIPYGTPAICRAAAHTQIGDTVCLQVWSLGNKLDPQDRPVFFDSLPIGAGNVGKDIEFRLALELIQSLLNRVISVDWYIERPRELPLTAPELILRIGSKALVLPPPELMEASAGMLVDPMNTRESATVRVRYTGMDPSHLVAVHAKGREGFGSPVLATQRGNASGTLVFPLPLTTVPANIGSVLSLSYEVTQEGIEDQSSSVARYEVTSIANPDINYPRMSIAEAPDHQVLNLNQFAGDAHWTLIPWLFIAVGTRMRVALSGQKQDGNEYVISLFDGVITANHVSSGLSGVIDRTQLKLFKDGTQIFGLSVANFSDEGDADTFFPMRELTIKTEMLARPAITQLIDNQGGITGQVRNGGTCDDTTPSLVGSATPYSTIRLLNGEVLLRTVEVDVDGIWRADVSVGNGRHSLTAQTADDKQVSPVWNVTVQPDFYEVTNFYNGNFNGWTLGEGGRSYRLVGTPPNLLFWISTPLKINNWGIILSKRFDLVVGAQYEFLCDVYNTAINSYDVNPSLSLGVSYMLETPHREIPKLSDWILLRGVFTATDGSAVFHIHNLQSGDIGNDFFLHNLTVRQLTNA